MPDLFRIEVNTSAFQLRLPRTKLSDLLYCLHRCAAYHHSVMKHVLEQLLGLLQFASNVVRPGRPFVRRLYALQSVGSHLDHLVRLNNPATNVIWWSLFVEQWNGVSLLWDLALMRSVSTRTPLALEAVEQSTINCGYNWNGLLVSVY